MPKIRSDEFIKRTVIFGLLVLCVLAALFHLLNVTNSSSTTINAANISNDGLIYGNIDAPVKIIEYSSFQCPSCQQLHCNTFNSIKKYLNEGVVCYIFKPTDNTYLSIPNSYVGDFDELNAIFEEKDKWGEVSEEAAISLLGNEEYSRRKRLVEDMNKELEKVNIQVIPTMFINDRKLAGVYSEEDFAQILASVINNK